MSAVQALRRISANSSSQQLAVELLAGISEVSSVTQLLERYLPELAAIAGAKLAAVYRPEVGEWRLRSSTEPTEELDLSLLAEALDVDGPVVHDDWCVSPLVNRSDSGECLVLRGVTGDVLATIDTLAAILGLAMVNVRAKLRGERRVRRLEAILEIAGQWNQTLEMESLLQQMAETSTRLLHAERASIFLWDRTNRSLVGRPALGVEGGELRVPDHAGVVGEVVQRGEPRRVGEAAAGDINREVDRQIGFTTRNLLCVPLRGVDGKTLGAFELINKREGDFTTEDETELVELAAHAAIALQNTQHLQQLIDSRKQLTEEAASRVQLIGESAVIDKLRGTIRRVAETDLALLVLGENGTGKEVVCQMIHYLSKRRDEPFVAVNCAALTETLLESELFGHEKGAFTDAYEARQGKFEVASGGTLFLDEIGDLSLSGQAKLLRVLEEKVVVRVGGSVPISTDTRVLAATNQDLATMVKERRFREDLFFRLNVVTLQLPPLRDRVDDVILLANHFLSDFCKKARRPMPQFSAEAEKRMRQHSWPGNVRELRNLTERLAYLTQGDTIDVADLAFVDSVRDANSTVSMDLSLTEATRQFQSGFIQKHVEAAGGNMSDAARRMGLHRSNLYRKMRQLEMTDVDDLDE